jgi:hypothetical protein
MSARPNPAELRLAYQPMEEPIRSTYRARNFKADEYYELVWRGMLRIKWDSPSGPFNVLIPQHEDLGAETYDEMRPIFADEIERAYKRVVAG